MNQMNSFGNDQTVQTFIQNAFYLFSSYLTNIPSAFLNDLSSNLKNIIDYSSVNGTVYLWDLLDTKVRYFLLEKVGYEADGLINWDSLPDETKQGLRDLKSSLNQIPFLGSFLNYFVLDSIEFDTLINLDFLKEKLCSAISDSIDYALTQNN